MQRGGGFKSKQRADGRSTGLARALSKLGFCSRSQAGDLVRTGRVRVNHAVQHDPERRVQLGRDEIAVDGAVLRAGAPVYLMLNKPRGLVTTRADEKGRDTVFQCFDGRPVPFVSPVGRLDQASEGLLLFTNDTAWAALITDPATRLEKIYHVQVNCLADTTLLQRLEAGVAAEVESGDARLCVRRARLLRSGEKRSWLEIVLDEGQNRQIRRLLAACGVEVLRLVRVAIGSLQLGTLGKGQMRGLTGQEVRALSAPRAAASLTGKAGR